MTVYQAPENRHSGPGHCHGRSSFFAKATRSSSAVASKKIDLEATHHSSSANFRIMHFRQGRSNIFNGGQNIAAEFIQNRAGIIRLR